MLSETTFKRKLFDTNSGIIFKINRTHGTSNGTSKDAKDTQSNTFGMFIVRIVQRQ